MTPAAVPPGNWRAVMEAGERLAKAVQAEHEDSIDERHYPTFALCHVESCHAARHYQAVRKGEA